MTLLPRIAGVLVAIEMVCCAWHPPNSRGVVLAETLVVVLASVAFLFDTGGIRGDPLPASSSSFSFSSSSSDHLMFPCFPLILLVSSSTLLEKNSAFTSPCAVSQTQYGMGWDTHKNVIFSLQCVRCTYNLNLSRTNCASVRNFGSSCRRLTASQVRYAGCVVSRVMPSQG